MSRAFCCWLPGRIVRNIAASQRVRPRMPSTPPKPAAVPTLAIGQKVEAEMTRLLYRSAGFGLFSNVVLALILAAGTLSTHPTRLHGAWLAAMLAVSLVRLALHVTF